MLMDAYRSLEKPPFSQTFSPLPKPSQEVYESIKPYLPDARCVGASEIAGAMRLDDVAQMGPLCAHVER